MTILVGWLVGWISENEAKERKSKNKKTHCTFENKNKKVY